MRSPMIEKGGFIAEEDKGGYTELKVLQSGAGYYVGTLYNNPEGYQEPGSRDSGYFRTKEEAASHLKLMTALGDDVAEQMFRKGP